MPSANRPEEIPPHTALQELLPPRAITEDVLRCVGCIIDRADEGATINVPDITTCTGAVRRTVSNVLQDLRNADLLKPYTPGRLPLSPKSAQIAHLRPTEQGTARLLPESQPDCLIRDSLLGITADQARVIRCIRCVLSKEVTADEVPSFEGVSINQVAGCIKLPTNTVETAFRALRNVGLIDQRIMPRDASEPFLYIPSDKGVVYLNPKPNPHCLSKPIARKGQTSVGQRSKRTGDNSRENPVATLHTKEGTPGRYTSTTTLNQLPSKIFPNGAELVDYLDRTFYGDVTYLNLLMNSIAARLGRRLAPGTRVTPNDVTQETLIGLIKMDHEIVFPDPGIGIIFGIANHKMIDALRKSKSTAVLEIKDMWSSPAYESSFESDLISRLDARNAFESFFAGVPLTDLERAILWAIMRGPEDSRKPIDAERLAAQFGELPGNVRLIKLRLLKRLRRLWET